MNLKLFPNEVKVDFTVGNKELFRIQDEIKQIQFNKSGSLVGVSTKLNKFYLFDYWGHTLIGIISYFHDKKYKIKNFCFNETNNLYIAYEYLIQVQGNIVNSGIKEIILEESIKKITHIHSNNKEEYLIPVTDEDKSGHDIFNECTNAKIFEILFDNYNLLICGNNPSIYDFNQKNNFNFIKQELISLVPLSYANLQKKKDLQIFIDNNEKNTVLEKNDDKIEGNNNNHFIIPNNNNDIDNLEQNNSINENKDNNDNESINLNSKDTGKNENNINNNENILKINNDMVIQTNQEIKEVDIKTDNNNINNNINESIQSNNNVNNNNIEIKIPQKQYNPYSIFIRFGYTSNTYYFIVKELYLFFILNLKKSKIITDNANQNMIIEEESYPTLDELIKMNQNKCGYSYKQMQFISFLKESLNDKFYISRIYNLNINGEIIHVELNTRNNLILINSTDRVVRLFEIINDSIILQKEYCDSVNKRKYTNCYFYTYKLKSGIQDLILMALYDTNGLEFCFIDIVSGNIIKKLVTFKYQVQDFICHYQNHFSILIISGKKIFCINGVMANQLDCLAPGLKYLEENVEYIEEESFYDNFDEKMKKQIEMQNNHEEKIDDIFKKNNKINKNIFVKIDYDNEIKNNDNAEREKSINELKELFAYVGQQIQ